MEVNWLRSNNLEATDRLFQKRHLWKSALPRHLIFLCSAAVFSLFGHICPLNDSPSSSSSFPLPSGHGSDGGASGRAALLLCAGQGVPAGRWGPQLHPPSADRAVQRLPAEEPWGPHHVALLLRAAREPGEAAARRKSVLRPVRREATPRSEIFLLEFNTGSRAELEQQEKKTCQYSGKNCLAIHQGGIFRGKNSVI